MSVDLSKFKKDFPIFARKVRGGNSLIYLDSGATSQKPEAVISAEANFYRQLTLPFIVAPTYLLRKLQRLMKQLELMLPNLLVLKLMR
jgi:hypothetical protein